MHRTSTVLVAAGPAAAPVLPLGPSTATTLVDIDQRDRGRPAPSVGGAYGLHQASLLTARSTAGTRSPARCR